MYLENLDSRVEVYFLSDDPQTTVHIEFIGKFMFMGQLNFIYTYITFYF